MNLINELVASRSQNIRQVLETDKAELQSEVKSDKYAG